MKIKSTFALMVIILIAIYSCTSSKDLVKITDASECLKNEGHWYQGGCWGQFEESLVTEANVDSVVQAQMIDIGKAYVKVNGESFTIDFFFPEQNEDEIVLIVSFKELEDNLLISFDPEWIEKEKFKAEATYLRGNILEGDNNVEPEAIAKGELSLSISEDFEVEIQGILHGESEDYSIEVQGNEAAVGAGTSKIEVVGNEAFLSGTLGTITYHQLKDMIRNHPMVETIVLGEVRGSINDDVNMHTGRILREAGLNTKVLANSDIASGGVDLFAAGVKRTVVKGAKLGVHSWAGDEVTGDELPKEHPAHQYQLKYFRQMLGSDKGADFYFYTLNSAPAEDIHYMSDQEIKDWTLSTTFIDK